MSAREHSPVDDRRIRRWESGYVLWGGALAWLAHLLLAYAVAEFGCISEVREVLFLGIMAITWVIAAVSLAALVVAAAAAVVAFRCGQRLPAEVRESGGRGQCESFIARIGVVMNGFFALIIAVQSVPVLYFLQSC